MLPIPVYIPFDRSGWIFELNWRGYRTMVSIDKANNVNFFSPHPLFSPAPFSLIVDNLKQLGYDAIFDGEIVVVDENGVSRFELLQHYEKTGEGNLLYYVFDLLYFRGKDLRSLPLLKRKKILQENLPPLPAIALSHCVITKGTSLLKIAFDHHLNGIIAKNPLSPYREGLRSEDWLNIKVSHDNF